MAAASASYDKSTAIAWAFPDRVDVRGFDLCSDLIGQVTLTDYFHLLLTGHKPTRDVSVLIDACFVALAEHGLVPSIQAARMTLAAAPDAWQGAVAAGLLGCGSVILGASEVAGRLLSQLVDAAGDDDATLADAAFEAVTAIRASRQPLPGFGHPVHKPEDPRATRLLALAEELGTAGRHVASVHAIVAAVPRVYGRTLPLNVSGAIPAVLLDVGFPIDALKGIALVGRTASLVGHLLEESRNPIGFALSAAAEHAIRFDRASASTPAPTTEIEENA
jgi:citrate synthase